MCDAPISDARLAAVPNAVKCVDCQALDDVPKTIGYMSWEHKTAPAIIIGRDAELVRPYDRRGMKTAAKVENRNPVSVGMSRVGRDTRVDGSVVNHTPSRCHPSQPRVSASGHCLSCAMRWYRLRAK